MKILYDHQMFSNQKYGGITRYFCELIKCIHQTGHDFEISLLSSDNQYLWENRDLFRKRDLLPGYQFRGKHYFRTSLYKINKMYSRYRIARKEFDLLHPTYYDDYFSSQLKKPMVLTVHDLTAFKFSGIWSKQEFFKQQMKHSISRADRIIAISHNTKNDLIDILNVESDKIDVIHHGFMQMERAAVEVPVQNYLLFVGTRSNYKNFSNLVEALGSLFAKDKSLNLFCVGYPFNQSEYELLKKNKILERTQVRSVDDKMLSALYQNALAFVFPSRYEGFGMPILEAYANDCPVCLSHSSCFPEVAGDAGAYFDPTRPESIAEAIEKVIYDAGFSDHIVASGRKRLELFSWEKTARQTLATYERAISRAPVENTINA